MNPSSTISLRVRLLLLLVIVLVPSWVAMTMAHQRVRTAVHERKRDEAVQLALLTSAAYSRFVENTEILLSVLAQAPEVKTHDPEACTRLLSKLLPQYSMYANLGSIDPDGQIWCSALPMDGPVDVSHRTYFQRAMKTKMFSMGDYQVGRISKVSGLNFGYPVLDDKGEVKVVLYAALSLSWVNRFGLATQLMEGNTITLVDSSATILAQFPDGEDSVGKTMPHSPLIEAMRGGLAEGLVETMGADKCKRINAYTRLRGNHEEGAIYVIFSVPLTNPAGGNDFQMIRWMGIVVTLAMIALILVWSRSVLGLSASTRPRT